MSSFGFDLFLRGVIPPSVQLAVLDEPGLVHNTSLADETVLELAKRKLSATEANSLLGREMAPEVALTLAAKETRATALSALTSANVHRLDDDSASRLLKLLLAKKTLPNAALLLLFAERKLEGAVIAEHLGRLDGVVRLAALAACDSTVDDSVIASAWGDGSWLPHSAFKQRQNLLVNLAYFRPGLRQLMVSCADPAPSVAVAGLPIETSLAAGLLRRGLDDVKRFRYMLMALVYNQFVPSSLFDGVTFDDFDLADGMSYRRRNLSWPWPLDLSRASGAQLSDAARRASGMKPRPTFAHYVLSHESAISGSLSEEQLAAVRQHLEEFESMLPAYARRAESCLPTSDPHADMEEDDAWRNAPADRCYYWSPLNPRFRAFCAALGEDPMVWRTAAELIPEYSGTLGELVDTILAI